MRLPGHVRHRLSSMLTRFQPVIYQEAKLGEHEPGLARVAAWPDPVLWTAQRIHVYGLDEPSQAR